MAIRDTRVICNILTGLEPENGFRCALPCEADDTTFDSIFLSLHLNKSELFPQKEDGEDDELNYCKPFIYTQPNTSNCSAEGFNKENQTIDFQDLHCERVLYANFSMDNSLVTDLDLLCNKQFQVKGKIIIFCEIDSAVPDSDKSSFFQITGDFF